MSVKLDVTYQPLNSISRTINATQHTRRYHMGSVTNRVCICTAALEKGYVLRPPPSHVSMYERGSLVYCRNLYTRETLVKVPTGPASGKWSREQSVTPYRLNTDNKMRSICNVEKQGEDRKLEKKENNIEEITEGIYVQSKRWEIEIHCRLAEGVSENTEDLWGCDEQRGSRTSLKIR